MTTKLDLRLLQRTARTVVDNEYVALEVTNCDTGLDLSIDDERTGDPAVVIHLDHGQVQHLAEALGSWCRINVT